jgi:hypothetical protein
MIIKLDKILTATERTEPLNDLNLNHDPTIPSLNQRSAVHFPLEKNMLKQLQTVGFVRSPYNGLVRQ